MPDEPTNKEILEWLSNDDYQCMAHNDLYDAQWNDRVRKAIRRRIERKVSREWVEKWAKKLNPYSEASLTSEKVIAWNETYAIDVVAMLKELGYEVDNA